MPIEDLKTWHWIIIGALAGLLMGYIFSLAGPPRDSTWRIPISNELFVDRIAEDSPAGPRFKSIEIHVPRDGRDLVTGEFYRDGQYHNFAMFANRPFVVGSVNAPANHSRVRVLNCSRDTVPSVASRGPPDLAL